MDALFTAKFKVKLATNTNLDKDVDPHGRQMTELDEETKGKLMLSNEQATIVWPSALEIS